MPSIHHKVTEAERKIAIARGLKRMKDQGILLEHADFKNAKYGYLQHRKFYAQELVKEQVRSHYDYNAGIYNLRGNWIKGNVDEWTLAHVYAVIDCKYTVEGVLYWCNHPAHRPQPDDDEEPRFIGFFERDVLRAESTPVLQHLRYSGYGHRHHIVYVDFGGPYRELIAALDQLTGFR